MYKDDNMITNGYSETLLKMMSDGVSAPSCNIGERSKCSDNGWGLEGYPLASVYAPLQEWKDIYEIELGFSRGTIFGELDLPFLCGEKSGGGCCGR